MKKIKLTILSCIVAIGLLASCGASPSTSTPKSSSEPTSTSVPTSSVPASSSSPDSQSVATALMPGIKSSFAHDITLGLEGNGIPKAKTETIADGFQYDASNDQYSYSIMANADHEVSSAKFMVLSGDGTDYLVYCASMPYESADAKTASQWVKDNIGKDAETTIGDAIFVLSNGTQGPVLEIKSTGFDDYVLSKI